MVRYDDLPTLSVKQPWASLLLAGIKRFEVRSWRPVKPGIILIHASSGKALGITELRGERPYQLAIRAGDLEDESRWQRSSILGAVDVVRVWPRYEFPASMSMRAEYLGGGSVWNLRWDMGRRWVFRKPVPADGALNIWEPTGAARTAVVRELRRLRVPAGRFASIRFTRDD